MAAPHGTYARYSNRLNGCRCEECRAAKAAYIRAARAAARKRAGTALIDDRGRNYVPGIKHGYGGYQNAKCRCADCTAAKSEVSARAWQRRRASP